jgi:hypothetical protein
MNNAANFLQYVQTIQNPKMLLNNPNLTSLKQKYNNPQQLAMQQAHRLGISPDQLTQIARQLGIIQ